ncbi:LysM domain protein [hydrothermal vent metagenome]|uniref:LysM domain protein n=1 Tax=hydrothermal vent metagenome TaxID=652676 RepID=A0A3B1CJA4_9ZZZZ
MKSYKLIAGILGLLLFFSVSVMAQEEKEMTEEEFQTEMNRLTEQRVDLTKQINELKSSIDELKKKQAALQSVEDCINEKYALVGATEADVVRFRREVAQLEGQIQRKESPKDDRQVALDNLKDSKLSALPEFHNKLFKQMQAMLDAWEEAPKEVNYTVVKGDYLWKIAKKDQFYGNGFAWPVIYNANRDQIKDPDLIYPKQVFKIPNLSDDEKAKYEKAKANYKPAPPSQ